MSVEVLYRLKRDGPDATLRDLDDVRLVTDAVTDDGGTIPAGAEGTVVHVAPGGATVMVEFAQPEGALVTVRASDLVRTRPISP
ncbi:hypothetical protein J2X36_000395 [Methylobacterium sp. BE186]|uniref:DUF4926 domain-containing protein n=1 Tax=Methylobacterium sp. BE186 TaxID=2817715 RepID=UPI00285AA5E8|nr:DUF4926 domain-containing protein [Methylobacterium sp. BE186]MDR7035660.1 hypothetical protein [Methylobacterium sp. BE186]